MAHPSLLPRFCHGVLPLVACLFLVGPTLPAQAGEKSAEAIVEEFIQAQAAKSEMAFIRMQTLHRGERVDERRFLALYEEGADAATHYLVRLVRPEDVAGVTVLASVSPQGAFQQSIYLPSIGRTRPLTGSAQAAPFLGSDFSYADLVNEIPGTQNYERRDDQFVMGAACHVVRATPTTEDSPYGFRDLYIEEETARLYRVEYYNHDGELIKMLNCFDYGSPKIFGNTKRPHRAVMTNAKAGTSTIFTVIVGRLGDDFDDALFTPGFVEAWTPEAVEEFMFQYHFEVTGTAE